mgnify:CR=1 FL=1
MTAYSNLRRNPFTGAYSYRTMDPEVHTIAELAELPGIYGFQLQDKPKTGSVTVTENVTGGSEFNQVTVDPSAGQCRIDYTSGYIVFNVADNGKSVSVDYEGGGSNASVDNITALAGNEPRIAALEEDVQATGGLLDRTASLENDVQATGGLLDRMTQAESDIDNIQAGWIAAKALPTNADRLLIEDAADSNNKKSVLIGSVGAGVYVPKFITGLTLSNAADADHDITVAAGARSDSTNRYVLQTDGITKQLDASWAAGTDAGGLFTGSIAPSTWYHTFLIRKDSDGTVDAGFDTSLDAVHIPVGYTAYGYIGSVKTDASSNIIPFTQAGNIFSWNVQMIDLTAQALTTSPANFTVSVPLGIRCLLYGNFYCADLGAPSIFIYSPDMTIAPAQPQYTDSNFWAALAPILTNKSSQIRIKASGNTTLNYLTCSGYMNTFL